MRFKKYVRFKCMHFLVLVISTLFFYTLPKQFVEPIYFNLILGLFHSLNFLATFENHQNLLRSVCACVIAYSVIKEVHRMLKYVFPELFRVSLPQ